MPDTPPGQEGKEFNKPKTMVNDSTGDTQQAETHDEMKSLQDQGYRVVDEDEGVEGEPK